MKVQASGWKRNMGNHQVGDVSLRQAELYENRESVYYEWIKGSILVNKDQVVIGWGTELKLNGDYLVRITLRKEEIADLFKLAFGSTVPRAVLKEHQIAIEDDAVGILNMTVRDLANTVHRKKILEAEKIAIADLGLGDRVVNAFHSAAVMTVADLTNLTEGDVLRLPNLGSKTLAEIRKILSERGLSFRVSGP